MADIRCVFVAVKSCGCCVAACADVPEVDATLLEWLRDGLTVKRIALAEWQSDAYAGFLECAH